MLAKKIRVTLKDFWQETKEILLFTNKKGNIFSRFWFET